MPNGYSVAPYSVGPILSQMETTQNLVSRITVVYKLFIYILLLRQNSPKIKFAVKMAIIYNSQQ
jgi:hypothetical protein